MDNNKALSHIQPHQFDKAQLEIIRRTVAKNTSPDQFRLFIEVCKYSGLNPFARQIYAVVRGGDMTVQTGIDGYRMLAERSGKYAGQIGPEWCGDDGAWKDVWLSEKAPVAARVGVLRKDFERPIWGVAKFSSYQQPTSNIWKKMPDLMLSKCAEALALRKAFPAEMAGIYTEDEMDQADSPVPAQMVTYMQQADEHTVEGEVVTDSPASPAQSTTPAKQSQPTPLPSTQVPRAKDLHERSESLLPGKWEDIKARAKVGGVPDDNLTTANCAHINRMLDTLEANRAAKAS